MDSPRASSPSIEQNEDNHHLAPSSNNNNKTMTPSLSAPISPVSSPVVPSLHPHSTNNTPPPPEQPLDNYIIGETLGTGQFGRVHLAQSKADDQFYAIKTLDKHDVVRLRQTQHINNEQAILNKISHPFLVNLVDSFQDDSHLFFVMEYVQGGELFRILRQQKRFSEKTTEFYAAEVILALEYLHERDIAYRDLKPENILLDSDGHVKLVDFGFAKKVPDLTWTVCGTPDYFGKYHDFF